MTPCGSITDVAGITVGHHQRRGSGWRTGTTVVLAPDGATPGVDVRGGGPGTRETDALRPENLIQTIHAVCLTGGSAYGLRAADGVMDWLAAQHLGFSVGPEPSMVVPVVPAAVIFDLGRNGRFECRPDASFGHGAVRTATARQNRWGSVGAGTGAVAGGLKGGVGTASAVVDVPGPTVGSVVEVTVGAIAVVNANGRVIDPATMLPWDGIALGLEQPSKHERRHLTDVLARPAASSLNTTIGVVATSARLDKVEVSKIATVAHDGLARAIRPAHSMVDGDTVFALATGVTEVVGDVATRRATLGVLLDAAATTFATACLHAVVAAKGAVTTPSYSDVCPTVVDRWMSSRARR